MAARLARRAEKFRAFPKSKSARSCAESFTVSQTLPDQPQSASGDGLLSVRFRRDPADLAKSGVTRGQWPGKQARAYYLDGLTAVFQPGVWLPGPLRPDQKFSGTDVLLLNPGPDATEVLGLENRFPEIRCLHIVETSEANLNALRKQLQPEAGRRWLPEMVGYITDLRHLPDSLLGRCDLAVEVNVVDPQADRQFRADAIRQISRALQIGGVFYSAGVTVRWTDRVAPLNLVRVNVRPRALRQAGYSDALPRPVFFLKRSPDEPAAAEASADLPAPSWREKFLSWWRRDPPASVQSSGDVVPRVEDGRGEPNAPPWDFLITKPAIRRPALDWTPQPGDRFGPLTLGSLLQRNRQTGMNVFRVQECPGVVLKIMKPFAEDIPDDPLVWDRLRKSKTLKRENQALKLFKGLSFIPQRVAHGYEPLTGWYAIVVEHDPGRPFSQFITAGSQRRERQSETAAEVGPALEPLLKLLKSLAIIHEKGVVHQDLKPAHVLLRPTSTEAVLIDWGLARKIDEPLSEQNRSCSWIHSPPERLDVTVSAAARPDQDLYAVGVMLLQLGSNWDFEAQPRLLADFFVRHGQMPGTEELTKLLRPHWQWTAPVIARAISSRRDVPGYAVNRYARAEEMAADFRRLYDHNQSRS